MQRDIRMCSSEAKVILAVVSISSGAAVTRWRRLSDALAAIRGKKVCKTYSYFVIDECMERKEKDKSDA